MASSLQVPFLGFANVFRYSPSVGIPESELKLGFGIPSSGSFFQLVDVRK